MLLLTTTFTVIISMTGFLPKPKYSQTPSEQALRDFSKLGGISRRAVFSVFLFTEQVRHSAANPSKGGRLLEQKYCLPRIIQEDTPICQEEEAETPPSSPHIILYLQTVWVLAQCNFNDSARESRRAQRLSWLSWRLVQCNKSARLSLNPHGAAQPQHCRCSLIESCKSEVFA